MRDRDRYRVELAGLPDEVRHHQSLVITSEHVRPLREIEREYILAALERNHGNRTLTAQQLKIGPATLFRKLKEYADGHWALLFLAEVARRTPRTRRCRLTNAAGAWYGAPSSEAAVPAAQSTKQPRQELPSSPCPSEFFIAHSAETPAAFVGSRIGPSLHRHGGHEGTAPEAADAAVPAQCGCHTGARVPSLVDPARRSVLLHRALGFLSREGTHRHAVPRRTS